MAKLQRRSSMRLRGWDYTANGAYFVTICTHQRQNLFEHPTVVQIIKETWTRIPGQPSSRHVILDEWVVMPNHLHGILILSGKKIDLSASSKVGLVAGSISAIIGNFKSVATRQIHSQSLISTGKIWQRGYYDRIIRNERELRAIREYIQNNPLRWEQDRDNLEILVKKMRLVL